MKTFILVSLIGYSALFGSFKTNQLTYQRVKQAYDNQSDNMLMAIKVKGISSLEIALRVFKEEQLLEVWAKDKNTEVFDKLLELDVCNLSGDLGPKRSQGDLQMPEGFYHINRFNPESWYHLSLGLDYPNNSDRRLSKASNRGGDIFIHGGCLTIGCFPMENNGIEKIYILAVEAMDAGQTEIPVHIFPFKMTSENMKAHEVAYPNNQVFWKNIKEGYQYFEEYKSLPEIEILENGEYQFTD